MTKPIGPNEIREICSRLLYMNMEGFTEEASMAYIAKDFDYSPEEFHDAFCRAKMQAQRETARDINRGNAEWIMRDLLARIHFEIPRISKNPHSLENLMKYLEGEIREIRGSSETIMLALEDLENGAPSKESFTLLEKAFQLCYP